MSTLAIKGAKLVDGTGRKPVEVSVIVIRNGRIDIVGQEGDVRVPSDAKVIEAYGKTVIPGLIDAHVHLASESTGQRVNPSLWELTTPYVLKVLHAVRNANVTLDAGFTTIRNMGHQWTGEPPWDVCLRDAIRIGIISGPTIVASANIISMTVGHPDIFLPSFYSPRPVMIADGADQCRRAVRETVRAGADFIKISVSGGGVLGWGDKPSWRNYTLEEITAITSEAHALERHVAAHAVGAEGIKNAIRAGVDTIEHGYYLDDEGVSMMKEKSTILVPTISAVHSILEKGREVQLPEEQIERVRQFEGRYVDLLAKAKKSGVKIASGTDAAGTWGIHGNNAMELELKVKEAGFSPMEAIVSATRVSAEAVGLDKEVGIVETGKKADLLLVDGDPLVDIGVLRIRDKISLAIKEGCIVADRRA